VVDGQASVLRATVMGLLLLAAMLLDRESQLMNALALAMVALLVWRPGDLAEPGFQLSFAATAGIIYLTPVISSWHDVFPHSFDPSKSCYLLFSAVSFETASA
jgi:ComEC/Rec2-related protein